MATPMNALTALAIASDPPLSRKAHPSRKSDATLMDAFLRKEPDAARQLYDRSASRIYGLGLFLLRNRSDAQDLVQDTFVKLWRTGATFNPERGSLDSWIVLTARGLAIDLLRRRSLEARKVMSDRISEASDEPGPEWHAEIGDLVRRASDAMARLSPGQRSVLELRYLGERSTNEVAELLGIPRGTVKSRAATGMAVLQRAFQRGDDDVA